MFIKKEYRSYYYLLKEKPMSMDEIILKLDIELSDGIKIITNMELENLIYQDISGKYRIKL